MYYVPLNILQDSGSPIRCLESLLEGFNLTGLQEAAATALSGLLPIE